MKLGSGSSPRSRLTDVISGSTGRDDGLPRGIPMPWFLREPGRAHPHLIRRCVPYPCLDTRLPMERDSASFHPRLVTVTSRDSRPRDSQHRRHSRLPYLRDTAGSSRGLCSSCPVWLYRPDDQGPSPFPLNRLASRSGPSPCSLPCTVHSRRAVPRTASRTSLGPTLRTLLGTPGRVASRPSDLPTLPSVD